MPISIHGKEYVTVAERVAALHEDRKKGFSIVTEVLLHEPSVVVKATVTLEGGETFTGISAANPAKAIEKASPYEVAETSAVGRALGFAGYGIVDSIASADEVIKATTPVVQEEEKATLKQAEAIMQYSKNMGKPLVFAEVSSWSKTKASLWISAYHKKADEFYAKQKQTIKTPEEAKKAVENLKKEKDLDELDLSSLEIE